MMETIIDLAIYIFSFFRGRTQKNISIRYKMKNVLLFEVKQQ